MVAGAVRFGQFGDRAIEQEAMGGDDLHQSTVVVVAESPGREGTGENRVRPAENLPGLADVGQCPGLSGDFVVRQ